MVGRKRWDFQVLTGRLADRAGGKRICHALEGERATSHVRSWVEWPLASSLTGFGEIRNVTKLRADLGC